MERFVFLAATVLLTTFGQLMIKWRSLAFSGHGTGTRLSYFIAMFTDLGVLLGLMSAILASCFWVLAIQKTPLGLAYPFMALSFVLVPIGSACLFGDRISALQLVGGALIIAGVTFNALAR